MQPRGRRWGWVALWCGAAIVTVAAVNASAATAAGQSADGELIDVGRGRRMYLECHGQGGPTVVFESGYPNDGTVWSLNGVFEAVAGSTRACVYDRPGTLVEKHLSRSDAAPQPRTALDVVTDLHALLQAAGEPGPYVFVAHSIGGLFVRLYASTYPDEVAGMVLVDTSSEDQVDRFKQITPPELVDSFVLAAQNPPADAIAAYPQIGADRGELQPRARRDGAASRPRQPRRASDARPEHCRGQPARRPRCRSTASTIGRWAAPGGVARSRRTAVRRLRPLVSPVDMVGKRPVSLQRGAPVQ